MKSLPSRTSWHGVSRFEPNKRGTAQGRTQREIRSSPVYAGHAIKPLKKHGCFDAGACSLGQDRSDPARRSTPARIPPERKLPFPSSNPCGCPERNGLLSIGFSECVHRRASNRQHVRKALFNESLAACQALNRLNLGGQALCTPYGSDFPAKNASRLAITQSCIAVCDSSVWPPICGVRTTFGNAVSASGPCGSVA
jgi:hypothetical protein